MKGKRKEVCEECGEDEVVDRYQGKDLCRKCLCPNLPPPKPWETILQRSSSGPSFFGDQETLSGMSPERSK